MVPIHSQQPWRGYFTRLTYWALFAAIIFTLTTVLFARAAAQNLLNRHSIYSMLATRDLLSGLFTTKKNKKLEAALLASLVSRPTNLSPNAPLQMTMTSTRLSKAQKFYTSKWTRRSAKFITPPRRLVSWQNKLPDHPCNQDNQGFGRRHYKVYPNQASCWLRNLQLCNRKQALAMRSFPAPGLNSRPAAAQYQNRPGEKQIIG